jgi:hypothetical protein
MQVGFPGGWSAKTNGLTGHQYMRTSPIGFGINRYGFDAQRMTAAHYTDSDFTPIGYQYFLYGSYHWRNLKDISQNQKR